MATKAPSSAYGLLYVGIGFRIYSASGLGFRSWGSEFSVEGLSVFSLEFRLPSLGFTGWASEMKVSGLEFWILRVLN